MKPPSSSPTSPLATPTATREALERHGITLKKSLGQNFLVNDAIVGKIVRLADVRPEDVILEVGPGIGTLTYALLERAKAVVSIERDPALPPVLADTLGEFSTRFTLVRKDALDFTAADLPGGIVPDKFVANLPYAVAATVVLDYFQNLPSIGSATVMVQREVAERMAASPGSKTYGAYTVKLSMFARPAGSFAVAPSNFMPPPRVDSTVLRLDRVSAEQLVAEAHVECAPGNADALMGAACTMADAAFFARRKTIANSCKQYFSGRDKRMLDLLPDIFDAAGIGAGVRGETLSTSDYLRLGAALLAVAGNARTESAAACSGEAKRLCLRKATLEDLDSACEVIEDGRAALKALGTDQWQGASPNREMVERDIACGKGHVATDGERIVGYMMLDDGGDPMYDAIDGAGWLTDCDSTSPCYLVAHRVAVRRSAQGTGVGKFMLSQAARVARERGLDSIRIDTHEGNVVMRGLLSSLGFTECGIVLLEADTQEFTRERIGYELLVR